jgi:hypothetical protein
VATVFPSLSAMGSWEEVLLLSMDFTVSQNFLEFVLQDENASLCFPNCLCILVPNFPVAFHGGYSMLMQYATGCFCAGQGQASLE